MQNKFTAPQQFTFDGKLYVYDIQRNVNDKGHLLPSMHYYYRINGKGEKLPFPERQLVWMVTGK